MLIALVAVGIVCTSCELSNTPSGSNETYYDAPAHR